MEITKQLLEKYLTCPHLTAKWVNKRSVHKLINKINELGYGQFFNIKLTRGKYHLLGCQDNADKICRIIKP